MYSNYYIYISSGSIIITGAKSIQQIKEAYIFINNVLKNNYKTIKGRRDTEYRSNDKNSNEIRKMMRKKRLFYVKKNDFVIPSDLEIKHTK